MLERRNFSESIMPTSVEKKKKQESEIPIRLGVTYVECTTFVIYVRKPVYQIKLKHLVVIFCRHDYPD